MSRLHRRRRFDKWQQYARRYTTPAQGGFLNVVHPIGYMKSTFKLHDVRWSTKHEIIARRSRRSR